MKEIEFKTSIIRPVECMREGWELIKDEYWLFFAITLVAMLIAGFIPFGIGLGAMFCGIYFCIFKKMNGEKVAFEDVFKGFNYFVPALIATLVFIVPAMILSIVSYIPLVLMQIRMMNSKNLDVSEIYSYFGFFTLEMLLVWLILGCIHAFLFFAYPLIVEREMAGFDAFKLSSRAVWQNLGSVVNFILLEFLLGFVGSLFCFVGVYFTLPVMFAGTLVVYRKVFHDSGKQNFNPPSPDAFRGAGSYT